MIDILRLNNNKHRYMVYYKRNVFIALIIIYIIFLSNTILVDNYARDYLPDYFDNFKLKEQKYRCIKYFNENIYQKYTNIKCSKYEYDYVLFKLEKSYTIFMILSYNIIINILAFIVIIMIIT